MEKQPTEPEAEAAAPAPRIRKKAGPSLVWLIPLVTAIIGGWLIYKTVSERGPQVTIAFKTAEGIEAGKTQIKYRDIEIGVVDAVHFSPDYSHVILKANMAKEAADLLRRGTRFWVVRPRLSLYGVSNLGTLVSGVHIEIEPGQGAFQRQFEGLDAPPVVTSDVAGTRIVLVAKRLGSIDTGSPVLYQGILAGEILGWELGNDQKSVFVHAFVKSPYNKLLRSNTRFWNVSGLDVSVGSEGINIRTASVRSLLFGGVAFETPASSTAMPEDLDGLVFTLHDNYRSIREKAFTQKITFILFFQGSVRGLNIGAPVEFKGIKIGSVVDVRLEFDNRDASFRIPVLIEIEPERVVAHGDDAVASPYQMLKNLVDRGLRARLQTGSLLTGQLFVELDMHPDTPVRLAGGDLPFPELPTIPAPLEQMTTSVQRVLANLEKVDMERISTELLGALASANRLAIGANELIRKSEVLAAVNDMKVAVHAFTHLIDKLDRRVEPVAEKMEMAIVAGRRALEKAQTTMGLIDRALAPDSPMQYRFVELAEELTETARSIRTLVDMLERNPNAVIFGKQDTGEK